ncbi:MAG: hypothetical protein MJA82_16900 [Clostridia bacterium]|nr:hypothetical protein [Clostridia bacterium]
MKNNKTIGKITTQEIGITSTEDNKIKVRRKRKKILSFTPDRVLAGIIYSEILGKPKGRKRLVSQNELEGFNRR